MYSRIKNNTSYKPFPMPRSLVYIKELAAAGVDWKGLHLIDLTSLVYSIYLDRARQKLEHDRQKRMQEKGYKSITRASEADFDAL